MDRRASVSSVMLWLMATGLAFLGFLRRPFCCVNGPPLSILSPIGELAISPVDKTRFIVAA